MTRTQPRSDSGRHRNLLFAGKFLALLVLFYVIIAINPVNDHVIVPFTAGITRVTVAALEPLERDVRAIGTTIASSRFSMDVKNGCNAVETMMLFAAAVLSFPSTARLRLLGLAIGVPIIQVANVIRLVTLFWLGAHHPAWFEAFHIAVWQSVIILIGVGTFAIWSARFAAAPADRRS